MIDMKEIISSLEDIDQQLKNQQEENKRLLAEIFNLRSQLDDEKKEKERWKEIAVAVNKN